MLRFLLSRLAQALFTLWLLVGVVFFLGRVAVDPIAILLPQDAGLAERAALRHSLGLDKPVIIQYLDYLGHLTHLDLGVSYHYGVGVGGLLLERLGNSLELTAAAATLAVALAIPLGVIAALRRDMWLDKALLGVSVLGQAVPPFWLAIIMILLLSVQLHLLPTSGMGGPLNFVMPTVTLGAFMVAGLFRLTRSSMLEVLDADYVKFARIKGLPEVRVVFVHALRNALLAPVTFLTIYVGLLVGGTVIVETIFDWPGLGRLAFEATLGRDLPVMQGVVILTSGAIVISNLAADVLYAFIDPRIKFA